MMSAFPPHGQEGCWRTIGVWGQVRPRCPELSRVVHCHNCVVFREAARTMFDRERPVASVETWAETLAAPPAPGAVAHEPLLVVRLAGELFGMPLGAVVEVLEWRPIRRVPHARDAALLGIVNLRGEIHLCVSLEVVFGADRPPAARPASRRMLALGDGAIQWAVPVQEILGIAEMPLAALEPGAATLLAEGPFVRGIFEYGQERIGVLDGERVLDALRGRFE